MERQEVATVRTQPRDLPQDQVNSVRAEVGELLEGIGKAVADFEQH